MNFFKMQISLKKMIYATIVGILLLIGNIYAMAIAIYWIAITIPISIIIFGIMWAYAHKIFKPLSEFANKMEKIDHGKKYEMQFGKDLISPDQLTAQTQKEEKEAYLKHFTGVKLGMPQLTREANDYLLGKRLIRQTFWNPHNATPIIGWVGDLGSGKTMGMKEMAIKYKALGHIVIASDEELGADYVFESLEELYTIIDLSVQESTRRGKPPDKSCLILFDEIQNTFDARHFTKFPLAFWARLTQRRKYGFTFTWTSPKEEYVERRIRQMTKWVVWCSVAARTKLYIREWRPPLDEQIIGERPKVRTKTFLRENVINSYNSWAFVNSYNQDGPSVKSQIIGRSISKDEFESREEQNRTKFLRD